jgi:SOS response regulatory protein OraA/RecX
METRVSATAAPIVTATREGKGRRVDVHLDGLPWRALPIGAVAEAGLSVGVRLDRERARALNRALRRQRALDAAGRILRASDQTTATLAARLASRGVRDFERNGAIQALVSAGIVDDARFARSRAAALARRDLGDQCIHADLENRGVSPELIRESLDAVASEQTRAEQIVERDGLSKQTLARLVRRGFSDATLEPFLGRLYE